MQSYFESFEVASSVRSDGMLLQKVTVETVKNKTMLSKIEEHILKELEGESGNRPRVFLKSTDSILIAVNLKRKEGIVFLRERFIRNEIIPLLALNSNETLRVVFSDSLQTRPLYRNANINLEQVYSEQKLPVWPETMITLQFTDEALESLQSERSIRTWILLLFSILFPALAFSSFLWIYTKEKQLSTLKTDFVANVTHELKTPLSLIRMNAETLQLGRITSPEKTARYLQGIISETERLTHLIQNILNFSKLESGKKTYQFQAVDLNVKVEEVLHQYELLFQNKGFKIQTELQQPLTAIFADANDITEIILNLLDNAVKYSKDQKQLEIKTVELEKQVCLTIRDFGIGINEHDLKRVFQPFYRVENSLTQQTKGTGLGLSLVKQLVEACGGTIQISSEIGKGTTCTLVFKKYEGVHSV